MYAIRSYYVSVQFMEMGIPVCLALNMMDVAQKRGIEIDVDRLSEILSIPVVPMVARTGKGKKELLAQVVITSYSIHYTKLYEPAQS